MTRLWLATSCLTAALGLLPVRAQAQSASKQAAAQSLFEDARKLMNKGDFANACPKFADSQRIDPAPGTEFNLANCYEKAGQTASAWATFKSAAASYRAHNRTDWEQKARERAAAIEPKLSRLTIVVPQEANVSGLEVRRDGSVIGSSEYGSAIPVDPGDHAVEASAPGKKPFKASAKVAPGPGESKVTVGPFENEPQATTAPPTTTPKPGAGTTGPTTAPVEVSTKSSGQKTAGYVVLGVGAVGLAVGAVTGVMAMSKNKSSTDQCPNDGACSSKDAVDANSSAKSLGTISTVGFIVGGVGVAAGAILLLTAPTNPPRTGRVRFVPTAGPGGGGLTAVGVF
jgi:hypothetical protein